MKVDIVSVIRAEEIRIGTGGKLGESVSRERGTIMFEPVIAGPSWKSAFENEALYGTRCRCISGDEKKMHCFTKRGWDHGTSVRSPKKMPRGDRGSKDPGQDRETYSSRRRKIRKVANWSEGSLSSQQINLSCSLKSREIRLRSGKTRERD